MLPRTQVRLVDVPVALFRASERHTNDLLREIALMAAARHELETGDLFSELLATADAYAHRPASIGNRVGEAVSVAERSGWDSVSVGFDADADAADGVLAWDELLRRFDSMSRNEELLTLPADPALLAFRAWYVSEIVEQVRTGRDAVAWADAHDRSLAGAR